MDDEQQSSPQSDLDLVYPPITFRQFRQRPDGAQPLYQLVQQYADREIEAPPHARDPEAWGHKRRQKWVDRICDAARGYAPPPLGGMCIYMLSTGTDTRMYLNDGLQRIAASHHALLSPVTYGKGQADIVRVLKSTFIYVQNRVYSSHQEAAVEFVEVNSGTGAKRAVAQI